MTPMVRKHTTDANVLNNAKSGVGKKLDVEISVSETSPTLVEYAAKIIERMRTIMTREIVRTVRSSVEYSLAPTIQFHRYTRF